MMWKRGGGGLREEEEDDLFIRESIKNEDLPNAHPAQHP